MERALSGAPAQQSQKADRACPPERRAPDPSPGAKDQVHRRRCPLEPRRATQIRENATHFPYNRPASSIQDASHAHRAHRLPGGQAACIQPGPPGGRIAMTPIGSDCAIGFASNSSTFSGGLLRRVWSGERKSCQRRPERPIYLDIGKFVCFSYPVRAVLMGITGVGSCRRPPAWRWRSVAPPEWHAPGTRALSGSTPGLRNDGGRPAPEPLLPRGTT